MRINDNITFGMNNIVFNLIKLKLVNVNNRDDRNRDKAYSFCIVEIGRKCGQSVHEHLTTARL